jgi:hypothetical protein
VSDDRAAYVYRLIIFYPPGSQEPGWKPAVWSQLLDGIADKAKRREVRRRGFRWPRERKFLSRDAAYRRALMLRWLGAAVEVQRSEPVTWWEDNDAMGWWPEPADAAPQWAGPEYALATVDEAAAFAADVKPVTGLDLLREQDGLYSFLLDSSQDTP